VLLGCLISVLAAAGTLSAQVIGDAIGVHNLGPGSNSPIHGNMNNICQYCHAPHFGTGKSPLWNQKLSTQTYTPYASSTYVEKGMSQLPVGGPSSLCLSCHDGTVAPGTTQAYGNIAMTGSMASADVFGTNLSNSHPFSLVLPLTDSIDLASALVSKHTTADPTGAVRLIRRNVECTSCHNPHIQAKDTVSLNFLVRDSSSGQMCLACHDPNRTMTGQVNPLAGWSISSHATATNKVSAGTGSYSTVALNACISCHSPHEASGPARLLRAANEQDCLACHGGGTNMSPAALNVLAEFGKVGHPFPKGTNTHDADEGFPPAAGGPAVVLLNNNRHATCADCHNSHSSMQVTTFTPPPTVRPSQNQIAGISATDGITVVNPSVNQFENCLRCHGTSAGKALNPVFGYFPSRVVAAGDPLNVILEFSLTATSSHPVTHASTSALPQPSLLPNILNLDGITKGRPMANQIFCTDCHNSDDNREFGGVGPNGPHGSKWTHILERQYLDNQAPLPGQPITNLNPNPDLSVNGPYALCGKCHDLTNQIMQNTSFNQHASHITTGFSCSVCHTAHGMGATNATITGERLVNFDVNVVAQNGSTAISYNRGANSCTLVCHGYAHNPDGSVSTALVVGQASKAKK
jgi:predicted CXXCH cytochrome family protein